mmetsp:Transcript_1932/g.2780  ORF Transcript_1932/g.2780 Transcript_1932/m.2780 type:complete len:80 (+) Transcript_1932:2997-3236(+)
MVFVDEIFEVRKIGLYLAVDFVNLHLKSLWRQLLLLFGWHFGALVYLDLQLLGHYDLVDIVLALALALEELSRYLLLLF